MTQLISGSIQRQCGYVPCDAAHYEPSGRAPTGSGYHTIAHCSVQEREPGQRKKTSFYSSDCVSERGEQERKTDLINSITNIVTTVIHVSVVRRARAVLIYTKRGLYPNQRIHLQSSRPSVCRVHIHHSSSIGPSNRCNIYKALDLFYVNLR
jgi:hypothetical protein